MKTEGCKLKVIKTACVVPSRKGVVIFTCLVSVKSGCVLIIWAAANSADLRSILPQHCHSSSRSLEVCSHLGNQRRLPVSLWPLLYDLLQATVPLFLTITVLTWCQLFQNRFSLRASQLFLLLLPGHWQGFSETAGKILSIASFQNLISLGQNMYGESPVQALTTRQAIHPTEVFLRFCILHLGAFFRRS